jgi:hypothetical protein
MAGVALGAAAGCGEPARRPAPQAAHRAAPQAAPEKSTTIAVRKIAFDGKTAGFLKVKVASADANAPKNPEAPTYWVYDGYFTPVGFYTEGGATYRVPHRGTDLVALGTLEREVALKALLGGDERAVVDLLPMDAPRTLEGDAEAARLAAEKAKKAAAGGGEDAPSGE